MGGFSISKKYGLSAEQRRELNNRVDHIIDGIQKEASSEAGKAFMYTLGGSMAGAAVAYGVPAAIGAVRNARTRANKDKLIEAMKRANPELRNYGKRDVDLVYNSLSMHAPRLLEDPLLGSQVMVDALRRGNNMDIGALSNVSRLTGGSGLAQHESDAVGVLSGGVVRGAETYGKTRMKDYKEMYEKESKEVKRKEGVIGKYQDSNKRLKADLAKARRRRPKNRGTFKLKTKLPGGSKA